ncbi:GNAT family N-acetyltransferase [Glaesserella sp.]|uniref:GNAT family N-acetyltransferase n=1 Tax=Glaesserella sp. TaxID=2094731 RepID=UPI0035A0ACF6
MTIVHNITNHEFAYFTDEQVKVGELTYRYINTHCIDAFHTQVDNAFQGKGIAGELYNALIEFARLQHLKIKPSCVYIEKRMMRSHPELMS